VDETLGAIAEAASAIDADFASTRGLLKNPG